MLLVGTRETIDLNDGISIDNMSFHSNRIDTPLQNMSFTAHSTVLQQEAQNGLLEVITCVHEANTLCQVLDKPILFRIKIVHQLTPSIADNLLRSQAPTISLQGVEYWIQAVEEASQDEQSRVLFVCRSEHFEAFVLPELRELIDVQDHEGHLSDKISQCVGDDGTLEEIAEEQIRKKGKTRKRQSVTDHLIHSLATLSTYQSMRSLSHRISTSSRSISLSTFDETDTHFLAMRPSLSEIHASFRKPQPQKNESERDESDDCSTIVEVVDENSDTIQLAQEFGHVDQMHEKDTLEITDEWLSEKLDQYLKEPEINVPTSSTVNTVLRLSEALQQERTRVSELECKVM